MMRPQRTLRLAFAVAFFLSISLINFAHVEKGPADNTRCPACQLQHSVLGSALAPVVFLPQFTILVFPTAVEGPDYQFEFSANLSSRSPPSP